MSQPTARLLSGARRAAPLLLGGLVGLLGVAGPAGGAVPSFDATIIYPTEAGFSRAIAPYQRALAANPRDAEASYWLGYAYLETSLLTLQGLIPYGSGYVTQAIQALERTVQLDPTHLGAWLLLAEAYDTVGDTAAADRAVQRALAVSTDLRVEGRGVPPR